MNDINYLLVDVTMYLTKSKEIYKTFQILHAADPQVISKITITTRIDLSFQNDRFNSKQINVTEKL